MTLSTAIPAPRPALAGLAFWLVFTLAFAAVAGYASAQAGSFYLQLVRPSWAPPGWLFGPVWAVLYLLMAGAAWLVWREAGLRRGAWALGLYAAQLAANALWTWLFFVWHQGGWAMAEIVLLWALIAATIGLFARHRRLAAALLLPYLAWVSFACVLTWACWRLNPGLLG